MNILVLEDQDLMRRSIMSIAERHYSGSTVYGAATLQSAQQLCATHEFHLTIIDPGLPGFAPESARDRFYVVETIVMATPEALHIVLTGNDSKAESDLLKGLSIAAYASKTGLNQAGLKALFGEVSDKGYAVQLANTAGAVEIGYAMLSPREQQIIELMQERKPGQQRSDIYEQMAMLYEVEPSTAERYFKTASQKLRRTGRPVP